MLADTAKLLCVLEFKDRHARSQVRMEPSQSGKLSLHHWRYSSMVSNERYSASSRTGLYVLMNEFRMCCSIGLFAAAAKSSQSAGSCSTMFIVVLRTPCLDIPACSASRALPESSVRRNTASLRVPDASGGRRALLPPGAIRRARFPWVLRGADRIGQSANR